VGTISHDALIVTGWGEHIEKAHATAVSIAKETPQPSGSSLDWAVLVSPICPGVMNGYATFLVAPDGSKEWWEHSKIAAQMRRAIVEALQGHYMVTVVQIRFGELGERMLVDEPYNPADEDSE
jgi:hypothetical protein